jgi:hypothetical protein
MNNANQLQYRFLTTLRRFSLTMLSCLCFCVAALYTLYTGEHESSFFWQYASFLASVYFTLCQLLVEGNTSVSRRISYAITFVVLATILVYPAAFHIHVSVPLFFGLAACALLPVAPFITRHQSSDEICVFSYKLVRQLIYAAITSALVLIGVALILVSLKLLFEFSPQNLFFAIAIVVCSLFFSTLTLSGIPTDFSTREPEPGVHVVYMLIGYLVIPLLLFYCAILHWYFLALVFTQDLPRGVIVYMTSGFGSLGILVYLAVNHSGAGKTATVAFYQKHFFKLLVVPIVLMAIAIAIRINQHGVTESRQIVLTLLTWLTLNCVLSFTRHRQNLSRFAYVSFAVLALLTALTL